MLRILYPKSEQEAVTAFSSLKNVGDNQPAGPHWREYKAGGTDVLDRVHHEVMRPDYLVDLREIEKPFPIEAAAGQVRIHASETLQSISSNVLINERLPAFADAIRRAATPQIRSVATLAGSLCQRPRCVYLRHPDFSCLKDGGTRCFAKEGEHRHHGIFDNEVCAAVHPSTPGVALLAYDARLTIQVPGEDLTRQMSMADFFRIDTKDATAENGLPEGSLILSIEVPIPEGAPAQAYERASTRLMADWAQVEVVTILHMHHDRITDARIAIGAVGRVPRRCTEAETFLKGKNFSTDILNQAAQHATAGASPLPHNGFKIQMCHGIIRAALERSLT